MSNDKNPGKIFNDTLDEALLGDDEYKKRPLPFDNPLARSIRARRDYLDSNCIVERWPSLVEIRPDVQDFEQAEAIRRYYSDRLAFNKLKTGKSTEFAEELYSLLSHQTPAQQQHLGMIYRLPYFYAEDRAHDELAVRYADRQPKAATNFVDVLNTSTGPKTLRPVQQIMRSRQAAEMMEFWFENEDHQPVMMAVSTSNSLLRLMQGLFELPELRARGYFTPTRQPGLDLTYYHLYHFGLDPQQF